MVKRYINVILPILFISTLIFSDCVLPVDACAALIIEPALIKLELSQKKKDTGQGQSILHLRRKGA